MARSIKEIFNGNLAEKASMPELNALTTNIDSAQTLLTKVQSPSKVADWVLWLWVKSTATWVLEVMWDNFKIEVSEQIARDKPHTPRWYATQAMKFQYGHELEWNDVEETYAYAEDDPEARVVTYAATSEAQGQVRIKAAKLVGAELAPISLDEKNALSEYMQEIKDAGVNLIVTTDEADLLKFVCEIDYNVSILNPDGSLIEDPSVFPVNEALQQYINTLNTSSFNGFFVNQHAIDRIQAAKGVEDIRITSIEAKFGLLAYSAINWRYRPDAGYMKIDPANPLSSTITYLPTV